MVERLPVRSPVGRAWARSLCVLALLSAVLAPGMPAEAGVLRDLEEYASRHYNVHTDLPRAEAAGYGAHMDLIHRSYDDFLSQLDGVARGRQDIYLLRTREGYLEALSEFGIDGTGSGGMFFYGPEGSGLATWVGGRSRGDVLSTLQHEGFHQFAHVKARGDLPLWVNEGLAEYFGDAVIVEDGVRHGIVDADRLQRLRAAVADGTAIPFRSLLAIDSETWRQNLTSGSPRGALQYDQSWAVVSFLIHSSPRVERAFSAYLVALSGSTRHAKAFPAAFGEDLRPMEAAFDRYLARLEPDAFGEALGDLRFLAEGLAFLIDRDGRPPTNAAALEAELRAARFRLTTRSHGVERESSAEDAAVFRYAGEGGEARPFVLLPPADDRLPPGLAAPALRPPARIVWRRDTEGGLVSELAFD